MGYSVATTVLAAATTQDLTDLAAARTELSIAASNTADDAWLTRAVTQISRAIATRTRRVLLPELVEDAFDIEQDAYPAQTPGGFAKLVLTRWPVLAVTSVTQTLAPGTTQALTEGTDFRVNQETGELLRLNTWTGTGTRWEAVPVTVRYVGGFGAAVSETITVPSTSPYTATVTQAAAFSCDRLVSYSSGTALERVTGAPALGQYSVSAGIYTFAAADADAVLTAAYATAAPPDDLVEASLRLINARYRSRGRDPSLVQRDTPSVGMERWWFGGAPGQNGPFPPDIDALVAPYCAMVVA